MKMCFEVPFGRFTVVCCRNGSYVEFAGRRSWAELSSACPPIVEESAEEDSCFWACLWGALLLCGLFCCLRLIGACILYARK